MHQVQIADLAWLTTFPHRVMPQDDEWLPGLLLRCDEANHWASRTTLTHILHPGPEKFHRCWRTQTPILIVIQPCSLNLDYLAQLLATPKNTLLATTYHAELARLYGTATPHPKYLQQTLPFHICPLCIAEKHLLHRALALPHITSCPLHQVTLLQHCQCGTLLSLFHQKARPFTCSTCGQDWAELPRVKASREKLMREQKFLSWYEFFFTQGTPLMLRRAMQLVDKLPLNTTLKRLPLASLVTLLVQHGRSPQDMHGK